MTAQETLNFFLSHKLKGLTIKNPYAWLMILGKIETRTWPIAYRGPVLVTAAKERFGEEDVVRISGGKIALAIDTMTRNGAELLDGHAIGIGWLDCCYAPMQMTSEKNPDLIDLSFCSLEHLRRVQPHGWRFRDMLEIEPFKIKGAQGLWNADKFRTQIKLK